MVYGRIISWEYSSNVDKFRASLDEYLLVVRTLLDIPIGPISIPVTVGPYQKLAEGTPDFHVKKTVEVTLPSFASNVETREESTICRQRCDLFLASWALLCLRCTEQCQFIL